ncbi:MAG: S1C family serine protease [Pirellulaceae bacterium]
MTHSTLLHRWRATPRGVTTVLTIALSSLLILSNQSWAQQGGSSAGAAQGQQGGQAAAQSERQSEQGAARTPEQQASETTEQRAAAEAERSRSRTEQEGAERSNQERTQGQQPRERDAQQAGQRGSQQPPQAWMGVRLASKEDQEQTAQQGVAISRVYPSGPAARAGLYSGDIIAEVDGKAVSSNEELMQALRAKKPNDQVELVVLSGDERQTVQVALGDRSQFFPYDSQRSGRQGQDYESSFYEDEDDPDSPEYAMRLEQERHACMQRERIEKLIVSLTEEVRTLRQEVQQLRGGAAPNRTPGETQSSETRTETGPRPASPSPASRTTNNAAEQHPRD